MATTRLLIDTDPGVDDAQAILMADAHPTASIEALTIVNGNVGLEHTVRNACRLVDVMRTPVPVHPGCDSALVWTGEDAAFVHGMDGFGDTESGEPRHRTETEHAALALIRHLNGAPGELTLVTIGPLTNLAVALKLDPELPSKVGRLVVMGGAVTGQGNVSNVTAEFNVYTDPEAAHIVFEAFPRFDLVDWEATLAHAYDFETLERWLSSGSARAALYQRISGKVRQFVKETHAEPMMRAADALAMAVALEPDIIEDADERAVWVEREGASTRGMTVVDWTGRLGRPVNARIVRRVDRDRFLALNAQAFA